jgi:hypothetical protein
MERDTSKMPIRSFVFCYSWNRETRVRLVRKLRFLTSRKLALTQPLLYNEVS